MIELHSYITTGNPWAVKDGKDISVEELYNRYVVPVAQKEFKLVPHFRKFTFWEKLLQDRARIVYDTVSSATQPIIWVDTDVLFIRECSDRLLELLGDSDVLGMNDGDNGISCGLMVYAPTDATIQFLDKVRNDQASYDRAIQCDQEASNKFRNTVKNHLLPKDEFFSTAFWIDGMPIQGWKPTNEIIPDNIRIFHATNAFSWDKVGILDVIKERLNV